MFFDLNVPISAPATLKYANSGSKKKGKQRAGAQELAERTQNAAEWFSPEQIAAIERRVDVLAHCEY
jgi:hypothetical protein